jgi:hypothetical protein
MEQVERLALMGLIHDLKELANVASAPLPHRIVDLARLDYQPSLHAILGQAEAYATPGAPRQPLSQAALRSIFSFVSFQDDIAPPVVLRALAPLPATAQAQDALFPVPSVDTTRRGGYVRAMLDALAQLAADVDLDRFDHAYPHLLAWLQRFGWCLPAHRDDVSLYDHARLTCAIAACLARYHTDDQTVEAVVQAADMERFCLIAGDLSGIQRYIFDIASIGPGGVARRLRARSFYLGALADPLEHLTAARFDVPLGNVIMASGGKFYVLVPNLGAMEEQVAALRREVHAWLHLEFNGEIAINLAHVCFAGALPDRLRRGGQSAEPGAGAGEAPVRLRGVGRHGWLEHGGVCDRAEL